MQTKMDVGTYSFAEIDGVKELLVKKPEQEEKSFKKLQILKSGMSDGSEIHVQLPLVLKHLVYGYNSNPNLLVNPFASPA
jgi:hypothetical protein